MFDPTPEQIEAGRNAMMTIGAGRFGLTVVERGMSIQDAYGELTRAALVAAAGAAPQEPLPRCQCYGADGVTDEKCPACTAPVQVDEAKLADVIKRADIEWHYRERLAETADPRPYAESVAHTVAEWLRGGEQ